MFRPADMLEERSDWVKPTLSWSTLPRSAPAPSRRQPGTIQKDWNYESTLDTDYVYKPFAKNFKCADGGPREAAGMNNIELGDGKFRKTYGQFADPQQYPRIPNSRHQHINERTIGHKGGGGIPPTALRKQGNSSRYDSDSGPFGYSSKFSNPSAYRLSC